MRSKFTLLVTGTLLAAIAAAQPAPPLYTVKDLGTLGGDSSFAFDMNSAGWVAGSSNLIPGGPQHAFLWYGRGQLKDLGTLGGPNSSPGGPNARGDAAVSSDTTVDLGPTGEDFCGFGSHHQCLAAVWRNEKLTALSTLPGGNNANTFGLNNRGQVVGFSEDGKEEPGGCGATPFQRSHFQAVIWEPDGEIRELPRLKGDTVSWAFGINDKGQAVGSSGSCADTGLPPLAPSGRHAVLWDKDGPLDLGNLSGNLTNNVATSINSEGEVAGNSTSSDGNTHGFLWTRNIGMKDLGTPSGDFVSIVPCCRAINQRRQVVGFSFPGPQGSGRAFLWQNDRMTDLNTLIPAGSPWYLLAALSTNDAGEIAGYGTINGETHAFLATPVPTTANAGPKDKTVISRQIALDGTASFGADGEPLNYQWSIPQGSPSAAILHGNTATPEVQFSWRGVYKFQLTVTDSRGGSSTDIATVNFQGN